MWKRDRAGCHLVRARALRGREPNEREALALEGLRPVALVPAVELDGRVPHGVARALDDEVAAVVLAERDEEAATAGAGDSGVDVRPRVRR